MPMCHFLAHTLRLSDATCLCAPTNSAETTRVNARQHTHSLCALTRAHSLLSDSFSVSLLRSFFPSQKMRHCSRRRLFFTFFLIFTVYGVLFSLSFLFPVLGSTFVPSSLMHEQARQVRAPTMDENTFSFFHFGVIFACFHICHDPFLFPVERAGVFLRLTHLSLRSSCVRVCSSFLIGRIWK